MLPVIFLLIFATIFGNDRIEELGGVKTTTYYVPAIISLAVVSATMQSLAISLTVDRENGLLKRTRGTPLPSRVFIAGRIGNSIVVSVLMLVVLAALGRVLYGVEIPWERLPAVLVTLSVGAAAFSCLGIRDHGRHPVGGRGRAGHQRGGAAPLFPLRRLHSGERDPRAASSTSPTRSRSATSSRPSSRPGTRAPSEPASSGVTWRWSAIWGLAGLAIAVRTFRWTPRA